LPTHIQINPHSAEPIFEQIIYQIKNAVAKGKLHKGDKLLSVREQAKEAAVNPNTVARAYECLERDEILIRRQGAGCFITGKKSALNLKERKNRLKSLLDRTVTEAFHLDFSSEQILSAMKKRLKELRFSDEDKNESTD